VAKIRQRLLKNVAKTTINMRPKMPGKKVRTDTARRKKTKLNTSTHENWSKNTAA